MGLTAATIRVVLAVVFIAAAAGKLADPAGSRKAAAHFGLSAGLADVVGSTLPIIELLIAAGLIVTGLARWSAIAALLLLGLFMLAIARLMRRGEAPDCHCFGQLQSEPAGASTLIRNGLLAAGAVLVLAAGPGRSLGALSGEDIAVVVLSVGLLGLAMYSSSTWRANRELRKRPRARPPGPIGLPVGTLGPELSLQTLSGQPLALRTLVGDGMPTVLVHINPTCGPCRDLAPDLGRWQKAVSRDLRIVAICAGELLATAAFAQEIGLSDVVACPPRAFGEAYHARATPSAVLIDGAGRVAARTVAGRVGVESLIRVALARLGAELPRAPLQIVQAGPSG